VCTELPVSFVLYYLIANFLATAGFHSAVHRKGRILAAVRHKITARVIGAYIEDIFTGEDEWIVGQSCNFIFALIKGKPTKLLHNKGDTYGVQMNTASAGLRMGGVGEGYDMDLFDGPGRCNPTSYTTAHPDYPTSVPVTSPLIGGAKWDWNSSDIIAEVFQCS
jgi:hypothetical protein